MGLTVVTHTMKSWGRDISKCIDSVAAAMPVGGKHVIIDLDDHPHDYQEERYKALQLDEYVAFVDDDDYISKDSLRLCLEAIKATDSGIAFTDEVVINIDGSRTLNSRRINYNMLPLHPQIVHHLTMIRTSAVSTKPIELALKHNCGIEWMMKADAALHHGAIHVPIEGYFWVQHAKQWHKNADWQNNFIRNTRILGNEIRTWGNKTGAIPVWNLTA